MTSSKPKPSQKYSTTTLKILFLENWETARKTIAKRTSPFVASIAVTFVIYFLLTWILYYLALNICNRWGENLKYYSKIESELIFFLKEKPLELNNTSSYNIEDYLASATSISELQKQKIKAQIYTIRERAITNLRIARDAYYWMTIFTTLLFGSTIVSGLCLYSVTKKGWDNVNEITKGIFIVSLGVSLFSTSIISVYQLEKNAIKKINTYQAYVNLEEDVFTVLAIEKVNVFEKENVPERLYPENLIIQIDKKLEEYSVFEINFDSNSIPKLNNIIEQTGITGE